MRRTPIIVRSWWLLAAWFTLASPAFAGPIEDRLSAALAGLDTRAVTSGLLADRVVSIAGLERFDGTPGAPTASLRTWRQVYDELRRAASDPLARPATEALFERARARHDAIPIGLVFDRYQRIRRDAIERGVIRVRGERLEGGGPAAFESRTAFAAAALRAETWRGAEVAFALDRAAFFTNAASGLTRIEADFGDGLGMRTVRFDVPVVARWSTIGSKVVRLRAVTEEGETLHASFAVVVRALAAPSPDDTLHVTGTVPFQGAVASGDAYVYLAPGRSAILNPVVVVEGFDLDNSMNWDELYALLNQEQLIETLRADGYDAVVLNFTDATDYLQRNAFVLVELLEQLRAAVGPQTTVGLAGASMGGLVGRYALAWLETQGGGHSVRTFISFDVPHRGANIPLGIQHWMRFFAGQSADAAFLLSRLDRPAARQMLVYHYVHPAGSTGTPDPERGAFLADLASIGDWPAQPRLVAVANGSGSAIGQGFAPGAQIIQWSYSDFLVTIRGHVWAVPNLTSKTIFDGSLRILFSTTSQLVTVSGTSPYDNAPGGSRATMTQMDTTAAPFGDIVAPFPSHAFIPTVSALAFDTADLFHNVLGDPDPLSHTPFDAIYVPATNQEHVEITPQNVAWLRDEIELGVTGVVPEGRAARLRLRAPAPNPFSERTQISFALPRAATVDLRVFAVDGREIARLASGAWPAGAHQVEWNGRDVSGTRVATGVYFLRLMADGATETRRIVSLR